ncbi:type III pantothenate kinase [Aestuariirhabdus sp. Z084]|uniref:type III pantothenate kinase n=1 Tax=Aestuariirhabdus haliotis TaxID=2918751 RepID=UPI00201B3DFF|nr:type III pantothenate kinase [Aestuariirhabdus haliotis]MCL6417800.1 type III pantothenate kinase [Aestuariirhabdus haliotis]MCL6421725.1 type III pantothenate kinase [Aestuariirhabdus haliotis]
MILDVDAGNTRIKWAVRGDGSSHGSASYDELGAFHSWLRANLPQKVCLGAVVDAAKLSQLIAAIEDVWSGDLERVQVVDGVQGVSLAYDDISTLGVDRWLALLAGRMRYPDQEVLIVDCGSAVTLDLLSSDGRHLGGYIVPGINMMRNALFHNTDRVKVSGNPLGDVAPGQSTIEAVDHGVLRLIKSLIVDLEHEVEGRQLLITGGDGNVLARLMGCEEALAPHLVLEGIAIAVPEQG